jgi:hypothetical protein
VAQLSHKPPTPLAVQAALAIGEYAPPGLTQGTQPRAVAVVLRHSFVSILSASEVPLEDISQLVGHVSTSVTETVYRHEIRPALTKGATAMDKIFKQAPEPA